MREREGPVSSSKDIMSKNLSNSEHEVIGITSEPAEGGKTSDSLYYEGMMSIYKKAK